MKEIKNYNVWLHIYPSEVEGEWVAHCLDFDVVSQGSSLAQALQMGFEASMMVAIDDLQHDRDPLERWAPKELWDRMWNIVRKGVKFEAPVAKISEKSDIRLWEFAFNFHLQVPLETRDPKSKDAKKIDWLPAAGIWRTPADEAHC